MRCAVLLLFLMVTPSLRAQQGGYISGEVRDRTNAVLMNAELSIQDEWTGARIKIFSDGEGRFATPALAAGSYKVTVRKRGFRTVTQTGVTIRADLRRVVILQLELLPLQQEVTVQDSSDDTNPTSNGLSASRQSATANLPVNGRDLHSLFTLIPGAVITPAAIGDGGQFTVGGQRPNMNSFRVDGLSANTGVGVSAIAGSFPGSTLPGMTAIGSTQNLSSNEEMERVDLHSDEFAPQSGDRPGAQVSIVTRSGSGDLHGSLFGYTRPSSWNGNDWFAQSCEIHVPKPSVDGYGASLGGPLFKRHSFFFASVEQMRVDDSALQLTSVPSLAARNRAPISYSSIINAFPLPTGCHLNSEASVGTLALRNAAHVSNYGIRLDQPLGDRANLFFRFADVPSSSQTTELGSNGSRFGWRSATLGITFVPRANLTHDIKLNVSQAEARSQWGGTSDPSQKAIEQIGSSVLLATPAVGEQVTGVSVAGVGQFFSGQQGKTFQKQYEASYGSMLLLHYHEIRIGGDYRRLSPRRDKPIQTASVTSGGVDSLLAGDPLDVTVSSVWPQSVNIHIASLFAQDTYRPTDRLTLLYGVRWELTPPVSAQQVSLPYVGFWNGPGTQPNWIGSVQNVDKSDWRMHYAQLAPRFGLAYRLRKGFVLRAGAGLFYDTGLASAIDPVNGSPFNSWQFSGSPEPALLQGSSPAAVAGVSQLHLPAVWEWRMSLQRSLAGKALLSASYVGSSGHDLLRQQALISPQTQVLQSLQLTSYGASTYHALQATLSGHVTANLYALMSYTWGHSIDNGSQGTAVFLSQPAYDGRSDRGSSDFDVRHNATSSLSYAVPGSFAPRLLRPVVGHWTISSTLQARTGFPVDITGVDRSLGLGFDNNSRPDLETGVPLWINNAFAPGGRQINPAAFASVAPGVQGTLGRNALTGNALFQVDASLHRQFRLFSTVSVELGVSAFNLLNHPVFANPVRYLLSPWFGQPTSMANLMFGSGSPNAGLTPVFQSGGPRSLEMNVRLGF